MTSLPDRDFLREAIRMYPRHPSSALWRALELRLLSQIVFLEPILDVGCGEGEFGHALFGSGRDITGIDVDPRVLRQAAAKDTYARLLQSDATRLPFPDGSFASALSNCVLEHVDDDVAVVAEMSRVLRPSGRLVLTVPAPTLRDTLYVPNALRRDGDAQAVREYIEDFDRYFHHLHYRSAEEWRQILTAAGLEVEAIEPYMPSPVVAIWDRLDSYLRQTVASVRSYPKLGAYVLLPEPLRRWLLQRILRKYYTMQVQPGEPHGCWLIKALRI